MCGLVRTEGHRTPLPHTWGISVDAFAEMQLCPASGTRGCPLQHTHTYTYMLSSKCTVPSPSRSGILASGCTKEPLGPTTQGRPRHGTRLQAGSLLQFMRKCMVYGGGSGCLVSSPVAHLTCWETWGYFSSSVVRRIH